MRRIVGILLATLAAAAPASGAPDPGTSPTRAADIPGRLDAGVASIASARRAGGAQAALRAAHAHELDVSGSAVEVVIATRPGHTAKARELIRSVGGRVVREYEQLVKAFVPVGALETVGRSPDVQFVREPLRPQAVAVTGQGVAASRASVSLPSGVNGTGVKIAIIDVGFQGLALRQQAGELPAAVTTKSYCNPDAIENGINHGVGVAEIVHEVAPGAELYLICIEDEVDLGLAKDYVVANGVKIVNFSVGFYNSSRGDGTGDATTPEGIVDQARASGVLWVNSAGNEARSHWSGSFVEGGGGLHAFAPGDTKIDFTVKAGRWACVMLKWDAWPTTATQDFDLFVYDPNGVLVAVSQGTQQPDDLPPAEEACFTNSASDRVFGASIRRMSGTTPRMDLFVAQTSFNQYHVSAGSVLEPATSPSALAVAALCWLDDSLQPYSSLGPTIDGRVKPDLAGFDAVSSATFSVSSSCGTGFRGTSAAAPHVAGVAALLMHRDASLTTPAAVQTALVAAAVDLGPAGQDNSYGAGKLRVPLPATNGLLAASALNGSDSDVYTITSAGTGKTTIVGDDASQDTLPSWSGDGGSIVLARTVLGTPFWTVNPNGTGLAPLPPFPASDSYPTPSPDGTRLAFVRSGNLYVRPADGSGATLIASGTQIRNPAWSPDGAKLAFDAEGTIFTVAATGGPVSSLFATASVESAPAWSPDGTEIAFVRQDGSDGDIYVGPASGASATSRTANTIDERRPAWSPDGTKLAFVRNGAIHTVNADGSGPQQLTFDSTSDWVSWQPVVPPSVRSRPTVSGSAEAGQTLTGGAGAWRGTYPVSFAYQWLRCDGAGAGCAAIPGATSLAYTATSADAGSSLRLAVTATNAVRSVTSTSHFSGTLAGTPPGGGGGGGGSGGGSGGGGGVSADLALEGSAVPAVAAVGAEQTFHLRAIDVNGALAVGVKVDVELPAGLQLIGGSADRGPGCTGAPLVCDLDFLSAGAPVGTIVLRTRVASPGELTLRATVRHGATDPNGANNGVAIAVNRPVAAPTVTPPAPQKAKPLNRSGTARADTLRGTSLGDVLRGLGGDDRIYGAGGSDRLFGGSGNDRIFGGAGRDLIEAGNGNDTISARDGARDIIRCGLGRDTVTADRIDKIAPDCERVSRPKR